MGWIVPQGPAYGLAADNISYRRIKISTCPERHIWRGTRKLFQNQAFLLGLRYGRALLRGGGLLNQPANLMALIYHARGELRLFSELLAEVKRVQRK